MNPERMAAIQRLQHYKKLFDKLIALIDSTGGRPLARGRKVEAQDRLRELKNALRDEAHELGRKRDAMNAYERNFLQPALCEAIADIRTHATTIPDSKWSADLCGARIDITHVLSQLENVQDD